MKLLHNRKGISLVETILSVTMITMISMALLALLMGSIRGWCSGTGRTTAMNAAAVAVQKLATDVRDGKTATFTSSTLTVTFPAVVTDPGTGEKFYDLSGTDPVQRRYYIQNGNLMKQSFTGSTIISTTVLAKKVYLPEALKVGDPTPPLWGALNGEVNVTLMGKEQAGMDISKRQLSARITLRNFRSL
jgi:type II secretory pathway pseudopilin PulG